MTAAVPLVLVVGPTASGKSVLAAGLAAALGGEVVSADAMAVYRGMDIATAKPGPELLALAPHHLIGVIDPGDRCDAARWLAMADAAIVGIRARGRPCIIAGGTPLYTKVLVEGLSAGAPRDPALRAELDARYAQIGAEAFHRELAAVDPAYAAAHHANDRRRLVRAMEVLRLTGRPYSAHHVTDGRRSPRWRTLHLGLAWEREALYRRINARARAMFRAGLVNEIARLRGSLSPEASQAVGCKEVLAHLAGACDLETAQEQVCRASRHLAKHQQTWYRRFPDIVWLPGDAPDLLAQAVAAARAFLDHPCA